MAALLLAVSLQGVVVAQDAVKPITVLKDTSPVMYGRSLKLKATVDAIDLDRREVVLRPASGRTVALHVDPRVKNLPDIKAGDEISVRYYQAVGLSLRKTEPGSEQATVESVPMEPDPRREAGTTRMTAAAVVDRVDAKGKTITIRVAGGRLVDLYVRDAEMLDSVKAGDAVEATFTEAAIVRVEPPRDKIDDKKKKKK